MKRRNLVIFVVFTIIILFLINPYIGNLTNFRRDYIETRNSNYALPISKRNFYMGIVPTPKNSPNSSFNDIAAAYLETGKIAEICMIWVEKQGIGEYELLRRNRIIEAVRVYGLKSVITLNFATVKKGERGLEYVIDAPEGVPADISNPEFRKRWIKEARDIALKFKPEYFSLGNEINDYFYLHPDELDEYLTLFEGAKREIKNVSPNTIVMVVFSYNHLIENNQWDLLKEFDPRVDIIGLTTYPWKQFDLPTEIPDDYYLRIERYTSKPIAFTEIGWISSPPASEKQQSGFLLRFLEITKGLRIEMINWLFLHEVQTQVIIRTISDPKVGTIALKKSDGTAKDIYYLWLDLKELQRE